MVPLSVPPVILVINSGSSSIKFALFDRKTLSLRLSGIVEGLGSAACIAKHQTANARETIPLPGANHQRALESVFVTLRSKFPLLELHGIGHRVVHGGEFFGTATRIDCGVLDRINELCPLAPLHNPANLQGIRALQTLFPGVPQVAVFDTAFHHTMPATAFRYALPERYYRDLKIRRYGAHGTSHQFVAKRAAVILGKPLEELQLITIHLGNGCSACAIRGGESVDTTMGLTPQEGMMMGTRSGDVDPMLHHYLATTTGESLDAITELLTKHSGLLGVSEITNDCRELESRMNSGDKKAELALDLFCYRAAKGILGMAAALMRIDALVFTDGIGENSPFIRQRIISHLAILQPKPDHSVNTIDGRTSTKNRPIVLVIEINEELAIAQQTADLVGHLNPLPGPGKAHIPRTDAGI